MSQKMRKGKGLTEEDFAIIQDFMDKNIVGTGSMNSRDIYQGVHKKLSSTLTDNSFAVALGNAVGSGAITGFEGRRRLGYIVAGSRPKTPGQLREEKDSKPAPAPAPTPKRRTATTSRKESEEEREAAAPPVVAPAPKPVAKPSYHANTKTCVHVGDDEYNVPLTEGDLKTLATKVLEGKEVTEGNVEFCGKHYDCNAELFRKFLFYFFEGSLRIKGKSTSGTTQERAA